MSAVRRDFSAPEANRLDRLVAAELSELSRSQARKLIEGERVTVEGTVVTKAGHAVAAGAAISVELPVVPDLDLLAQDVPLSVLYEDEETLVIDKAPGLVVHPAPGLEGVTLINVVRARYPEVSEIDDSVRPGVVHRLDRDTSGAMVFAKSAAAARMLKDQWRERETLKVYTALVDGRVDPPEGIIEAPLGFMAAVSQAEERDCEAISERLGRPYFLEGKLRLKPFPACSRGHPGIDAALALRGRENFKGDEIEAVEADLEPFSLLRLEPDDVDAAGFSAAFMLAVALIFGTYGLDQIGEETIDDPRVRALMKRVKHVPANGAGKVTVRLSGGRVLSADVEPVRKLSTLAEIEPKFYQCAGRVLAEDAIDALQESILRLDEQPNIDRLMALAGAG